MRQYLNRIGIRFKPLNIQVTEIVRDVFSEIFQFIPFFLLFLTNIGLLEWLIFFEKEHKLFIAPFFFLLLGGGGPSF